MNNLNIPIKQVADALLYEIIEYKQKLVEIDKKIDREIEKSKKLNVEPK